MSNRDSLGFGDLIPQDVVDIFAQDKHSSSRRKKRSHSLGRALGWLKGKKKKDPGAKGPSLGPALDLALEGQPAGHQGGHKGSRAHPQAVPKRDNDDRPPANELFQENVFIEASRPKYLENLHTEALEGLKMMQQEETNNGVEYRDNESTVSNMTVHTDGEGGGFMTDSTIADSTSVVSVKSSVSTRSSRSGLTRQESTFRPLNSGKKSKTRRRHRKTVAGIPKHVQKELGLDRVGWTLKVDEQQFYNGETDESPVTDTLQPAVDSQTGTSNIFHPLHKDQLEKLAASQAANSQDTALVPHLDPNLPDEQTPHSLAVPWLTNANSLQQELPSPVMSMSPQAAYMSKIIPNAVLPPSIDVVEISRGRSRNSVRTVSKSSLVLSSPVPSRASSRASTRTTSSKSSTITSASRQNPQNMSDSSCWSNSESSETLVSDSSTISSSSTPRVQRSQDGNASAKEDIISVHSSNSKASKGTSNGKLISKGKSVTKDGQFARSLSVMKPKRAPPPPSRSYSLHNKMKRRSRDLAELRVIPNEENEKNKSGFVPVPSKIIDSPGYNADTSSLDDSGSVSFSPTTSQKKAEETAKVDETDSKGSSLEEKKQIPVISPSSGYSSQEGSSAHFLKQGHSSSPRHKRGLLAKLQRLFPGSASSSPTPSEKRKAAEVPKPDTSVDPASPSVRALRELFNIPPHPKVHAPPAPPPEVWVHSKRSIELLLGPAAVPDNIYAIIKKNPKDRRQHRPSPCASAESSVKLERKHKTGEPQKVQESLVLNAEIQKENDERLLKVSDKEEKVPASDILSGLLVKAVVQREERLAAREERKNNKDPIPVVSLARSPPPPLLTHHPPQAPDKKTPEVVSPESSWPPPPPPIGQVITDEIDFPLPPPPMFGEALVLPVQVPLESSTPGPNATTTPLNIPPPPSYTAPPPPVAVTPGATKKLSPLPPIQEVPISPPPEEVSPPLVVHIEVCPPPRPPKEVFVPVPPKEVSPSPPTKVYPSSPQLKKVLPSPPPPKEVSPLPPPPIEVHQPTLLKVVSSPPPPPLAEEVSPPSLPKEVSPLPPQPIDLLQPTLPKVVSPPSPPQELSPQPTKDISPEPPKEVPPPPPSVEVSLLPPKEVSPPHEESSPPAPPPPVNDVSTTLVTVVSPSPVKEVSPLASEEISPASCEEVAPPVEEETPPISKLTPPPSIPPPPPESSQFQLSEQEVEAPQENIPCESVSITASSHSILAPPLSIPPPPPVQLLPQEVPLKTDSPLPQEPSPAPPSEASITPVPEKAQEADPAPSTNSPEPPPLAVLDQASTELQPSPASVVNQTETTTAPPVQEEPTPVVTPSLLQMVKLRSVNSSPEPPKAPEQSETEVTLRNKVQTSSTGGEAPQKPIRKSLIMTSPTSPTSTSPAAVVTTQPSLPKSTFLVVSPPSSSPSLSPTKKSPPAAPSMNLQEAIRLRTAARSKENPVTRLSLHSPTSPIDLRKSPSSTASFIFSKSNRKVVIETKPALEKKNPEVLSPTKVENDVDLGKKGVKVPPPVAKKPKTKGLDGETSEGTEQTAGQDAKEESRKDAAEETNRTAGAVEGGTPSA